MQKMAEILFASLDKNYLTIDGENAQDFKKDFSCEYVFAIPINKLKI